MMDGRLSALLLFVSCLSCGCCSLSEPLVDFQRLHPKAILDIRYATPDNFTHQAVYPAARCALRCSVAKRLDAAASEFEALGYRLKVLDCYRPLSVQKEFWALVPDERYVADPAKGSRHNRGAAVDVSLCNDVGHDLEMPTLYDDFTKRAHRDWGGASVQAAENRALLERVMSRHGFDGLATEWWHFDARGGAHYPVEDIPFDKIP